MSNSAPLSNLLPSNGWPVEGLNIPPPASPSKPLFQRKIHADSITTLKNIPVDKEERAQFYRQEMAALYLQGVAWVMGDYAIRMGGEGFNKEHAREMVHLAWAESAFMHASLPEWKGHKHEILQQDPFVRMFAEGLPLNLSFTNAFWTRIQSFGTNVEDLAVEPFHKKYGLRTSEEIQAFEGRMKALSHNVELHVKAPIGQSLLQGKIQQNLPLSLFVEKPGSDHNTNLAVSLMETEFVLASEWQEGKEREGAILQLLAQYLAYFEMEQTRAETPFPLDPEVKKILPQGIPINVPSFDPEKPSHVYEFTREEIGQGIKAWRGVPRPDISKSGESVASNLSPFYIFQGTTVNNYYENSLDKVLANTEQHASGYETFCQQIEQIKSSLNELAKNGTKPIVTGHSLGGSMTLLTGVYLNDFVQKVVAFKPPKVGLVVKEAYDNLPGDQKNKIRTVLFLNDFTWNVREYVIGQVELNIGLQYRSSPLKAHSESEANHPIYLTIKNYEQWQTQEPDSFKSRILNKFFSFANRFLTTLIPWHAKRYTTLSQRRKRWSKDWEKTQKEFQNHITILMQTLKMQEAVKEDDLAEDFLQKLKNHTKVKFMPSEIDSKTAKSLLNASDEVRKHLKQLVQTHKKLYGQDDVGVVTAQSVLEKYEQFLLQATASKKVSIGGALSRDEIS